MQIVYEVPEHLEGYISSMNDAGIQNLLTLVLEHAVNHKLLDYPKTDVEFNLSNVLRSVKRIESKQVNETSMIMSTLSTILERLDSIEDNPIKEIITIREQAPRVENIIKIADVKKEKDTGYNIKMKEKEDEEEMVFVESAINFMDAMSS